jgi:signal transduction histidine kinase
VLVNLLNNAAKFTEPGGMIRLEAKQEDRRVIARVKDTGRGIPPEKLSGIFELFTQVDTSLDRAQGGLGLGLALVDRLVKMHDGTVTVLSEGAGRGSEFIVSLPQWEPSDASSPGSDTEIETASPDAPAVEDAAHASPTVVHSITPRRDSNDG